jgi:hypothetical protein
VNDTQEAATVRFVDDGTLDYKTPFMKWSEEILKLSDTELVVVNADKRISLQNSNNKFIRRWRKEQVIKVQWGCVEKLFKRISCMMDQIDVKDAWTT